MCLSGYTKEIGTGNCIRCPSGTYKNSMGNHPCQSCPSGMYSTMEGETDDSNCVTCLGTVVNSLSGGIDCGMSGLTKVDFKEIL